MSDRLQAAIDDAWEESHWLDDAGLLDPDQPTLYSHLCDIADRRARVLL